MFIGDVVSSTLNLSSSNSVSLSPVGTGSQEERGSQLFFPQMTRAYCIRIVHLSPLVKTGSSACPMNAVGWKSPTCTVEQCRTFTSQHQDRCYCCQQCPPRWVRLGQSCFFLSTLRLSWEESRNNCTGEGGSLAVVRSQKVQSFLTQNGNGRKYWIGLRSTNDTWTWIDDNVLQQSYWGATQTTGDCGILSSDKLADNNWITSPCSSYTYYICQMQL
ncbi:C-type lectin domain family 4 member G isoform X3 [Hippocampus comes]|uniref:C-type lectin domain family 4 member G isoform X3 n=1 Tax=Hippocampus comes TaxID=109280 RepID=UPI00094E412C|nr:PREDICTED: C-type lectin domain family 4 member G-like isoform X3 [Hippocampus comes]